MRAVRCGSERARMVRAFSRSPHSQRVVVRGLRLRVWRYGLLVCAWVGGRRV